VQDEVSLKQRVILCLAINDGVLFRTKRFSPDYRYTVNFVDMELADELFLLDVTRGGGSSDSFDRTAHQFADRIFVPMGLGGFVSDINRVNHLFRNLGADKVVVNSEAFRQPEFITQLADKYGSQSVTVSIDVKDWHVHIEQGRTDTGVHVLEWAQECVHRGAGEILLMDIERDGSLMGYNLELIEAVTGPICTKDSGPARMAARHRSSTISRNPL
jgi:cyclase